MLIIDSQIHIWAPETPDRPWLPNRRAHREEAFGADEAIRAMDEVGVARAILVPPSWEGDRNDVTLAAAASHPDRFAVMGRLPLEQAVGEPLLSGWKDQPGMLGIRLTFNRTPEALYDGSADWFWPAAEKAGIPVMIFAPGHNRQIGDIAGRFPRLRLILDHVGLDVHAVGADAVRAAVDDAIPLAPHMNVAVKASALPSHVAEPYPFPSLHDSICRVVEGFGAERVFWGSDLTRLPCPYDEAVRLFMRELRCLSDEEKHLIMGRAIATWLQWPLGDQ
jgi:predicted TIM-barrel fold metal-dependent hydrolase